VAPAWLSGLGPIANSLGFAGLALLVILGEAFAIRTLWTALLDEQAKAGKRDALILDQETEHQRLLVRFEESMERLRESDAQRRMAEERARAAEERVRQLEADAEDRPPARRRRA
jgi:hypothetical protein